MEQQPESESLLGMYLASLPANIFKTDLENLVASLKNDNSAIITKLTLEDEKINVGGVTVIKEGEFAGYIAEKDMAGYKWLTGDAQDERVHLDDSTIKITKSKPKMTFFELNGKIYCQVNVKASASIESGGTFCPEKTKELEQNFAQEIKEEMTRTFKTFQRKYGVDALGLKEHMRKFHPRLYRSHAENWEQITLKPVVNLTLKSSGTVK